ncbi:hypothetical protein IQ265_18625 [Nodosilinea sp. LEGE 06152]|uniref:hypothetical protein n=1 Tax=Nodosilinea sp. LEGE 06152 TaxID=2777966 RepID=UPI001881E98B|nr:hypothetical protein [Nodosilinea sp. LEGE 06152]MBE9158834.1 hypothetical protein [Nodosilinea sp. LEGE 06152]
MAPTFSIRRLVEQALHSGLLTPDIEQGINSELTRLGYLPIGDSEALELLMYEMDEGRIRLVPGLGAYGEPVQQPISG